MGRGTGAEWCGASVGRQPATQELWGRFAAAGENSRSFTRHLYLSWQHLPHLSKLASSLPARPTLVRGEGTSWTTTLPVSQNVPLDHRNLKSLRLNCAKPPFKMEDASRAEEWKTATHMGIYGWRKLCLYLLILTLLVLVILNLALTLWVIRVMEFNTEGMGNVRIVEGGLEVRGHSYVLGNLVASSIRSRPGRSIQIRAAHNISISSENILSNSITLGNDVFEVKASKFKVSDHQGMSLFSADKGEILVGAERLRLSGPGGIVIDDSIQTPLVRATPGSNLSLESPTRSLEIMAPSGVSIESRAGDIRATCLTDFKIESLDGAIMLQGSKIVLPGLRTAPLQRPPRQAPSQSEVFQLCSCQNGKLFLAPGDSVCAADSESLVCR